MYCLWSVIQIMSAIRFGTCTSISKNTKDQYGKNPEDIEKDLRILKRCQRKLDCLIFWNAFIRILKPKLNKQCDLLKTGTKLVTWQTWFDPPRTLNSIYKEGKCEPIRSCCLECISSGILSIWTEALSTKLSFIYVSYITRSARKYLFRFQFQCFYFSSPFFSL